MGQFLDHHDCGHGIHHAFVSEVDVLADEVAAEPAYSGEGEGGLGG